MELNDPPIETIKEHVRKRFEASDKEFLFGSEGVDVRRIKHLEFETRKRSFTFTVDEPPERGGLAGDQIR